ncbi:MAG: hypothetical protein ABW172_09580 [Candidatus Binatia bacterium]
MANKSNNHGGRRPGAGRRAGKPNNSNRLYERGGPEWLAAQAYSMNFFLKLHHDEEAKGSARDLQLSIAYLERAGKAAVAAAPYCHPKLRPISLQEFERRKLEKQKQQASCDREVEIPDYENMSDAEMYALIRQKIAET